MIAEILAFLEIAIRIPPLFIMDFVLQTNFGLINNSFYNELEKPFLNLNLTPNKTLDSLQVYVYLYNNTDLSSIILNILLFLTSSSLFVIPSNYLKQIYIWIFSAFLVILSKTLNHLFADILTAFDHLNVVSEIINLNYDIINFCLIFCFLQVLITELFILRSSLKFTILGRKNIFLFCFWLPTVFGIIFQPSSYFFNYLTLFVTSICYFQLFLEIVACFNLFVNIVTKDYLWCENIVRYQGYYSLFEIEWSKLNIPRTLKIFWALKILFQLVKIWIFLSTYENTFSEFNIMSNKRELLYFTLKQLASTGCETLICVLGVSAILSSISNKIGEYLQNFLIVVEEVEEKNIGTITAILFLVLALQTGLTEICSERRFIRLYRNLCLLLAANLHLIHNLVNPLLLTLSASNNTSFNRHIRPLLVSFFLIIFPAWFLNFLWQRNSLNTWLLAVTAFCVEIIIKVIITIITYSLFMIDSYQLLICDKLDDYVFYIKSFGNLVEFVFAIFIFFNGAWILFFESGGKIRSFMICIHAYFNIYIQAKNGWKIFIKRIKASHKLNLLKNASEEQLKLLDDVCSICYQVLKSAKVTECNHYFHANCLKKWLNIQDICPLCHKIVFEKLINNETDANSSNILNEEANINVR